MWERGWRRMQQRGESEEEDQWKIVIVWALVISV